VGNYWFLKRATDWEREQPFYYFRLLEPDFTPLPVYEALVARAEANQPPPTAQPLWWYVWQFLRPFFLLIGGGILFFFWLRALAPKPPTRG
jgi:hypothetical protein